MTIDLHIGAQVTYMLKRGLQPKGVLLRPNQIPLVINETKGLQISSMLFATQIGLLNSYVIVD